MSENILVINVHSSRNLGDAALLNVAIQQLRASFPSCSITISMDDPQSHLGEEKVVESLVSWTHPKQADGSVHWDYGRLVELLPASLVPILTRKILGKPVYALTPNRLRPTIAAYIDASIVVSGAGGFIYSSGRGISLLITILTISLAIFAKKPVYMFPQSIGPLKHAWEHKLVRWMLDKARIVMVREPISLRLTQEIGVKQEHVRLIPDMAFALGRSSKAIGEEWLLNNGICLNPKEPLMGMTIVNWGEQHKGFDHQKAYEEACAAAIKWFIENNRGKVILFPQVIGPYNSQDDRIPALRVVKLLPGLTDSIRVVETPLPIDLLKSIYGWMDVFIGTRMHSNIFALSEGVPVIMIAYLPKTRGMAEMLGIDEWCLEIEQVNGVLLTERLQKLWQSKQYWTEGNKTKFEKMIKETTRVGEAVKDDYLQWMQGK